MCFGRVRLGRVGWRVWVGRVWSMDWGFIRRRAAHSDNEYELSPLLCSCFAEPRPVEQTWLLGNESLVGIEPIVAIAL